MILAATLPRADQLDPLCDSKLLEVCARISKRYDFGYEVGFLHTLYALRDPNNKA